MKLLSTLLFLCLSGSTHGSSTSNLRSQDQLPQSHTLLDPNNEDMKNLLKKGQLRGSLSFQELGVQDERDAQSLCTSLLDEFDLFPDWMECTCRVRQFFYVDYECGTSACMPEPDLDFSGIMDYPDLCVMPSFKGELFIPTLGLKTEACNDAMGVSLNVKMLDNLFPSLGLPVDVKLLPEVCATTQHIDYNVDKIKSCGFRIGDHDCECSVCENQQEVTVDCTGASNILGPLDFLAPLLKFECVGRGLLGLDGGRFPSEPFINPLLLLGSDELKRRSGF